MKHILDIKYDFVANVSTPTFQWAVIKCYVESISYAKNVFQLKYQGNVSAAQVFYILLLGIVL